MPSRPVVSFVAWTNRPQRAREIAAVLGGEPKCIYPRFLSRQVLAPVRYVVSAVLTLVYLVRHRPPAVIVTNPPMFAGLTVWMYSRLTGASVALDSHPTGFGAKDHRVSQLLQPLHRWLARQSEAVLVTTDYWVRTVDQWRGRGLIVHEAAPLWKVRAASPPGERLSVLFVGVFASDEPAESVVEAARVVPEADVSITGDIDRAPEGMVENAPENVRFPGYLDQTAYAAAVERADAVIVLTTEPTSVMHAAYEAVYAGRPLIVSDTPALRELFPYAVFTANDGPGVAQAIREVADRHSELLARVDEARQIQERRWQEQLQRLRDVLLGPPRPFGP